MNTSHCFRITNNLLSQTSIQYCVGGLEVLKRIRSEPYTQVIPVVILTTSDEQRDIIRGYRLGANSFIRKPVNVEEFFQAVQEIEVYWTERNTPPE